MHPARGTERLHWCTAWQKLSIERVQRASIELQCSRT
jgi:hypothetical protein